MAPIAELAQRRLFKPETKEQKLAVCSGSMPLPPEDRVEILSILAVDADEQIAERAQNTLLTQPVEYFLKALERADSDQQLFLYCTENLGSKAGIADALARNVGCPTTLVTRLAGDLTSFGIQALLDELNKGAISLSEMEEAAVDLEPDAAKRETLMQRVSHMTVVQRLMLALKGGRSERLFL